mmetsp:Transcript_46747/g.53093  ORF Transcript_46747/g.53093 Transcript_46747/m.53093 type:complete len:260 (+) Transcript_46747:796-1575(+)
MSIIPSSGNGAATSTNIRTGFQAQKYKAAQKDRRHEHLQANVKPADLTDNDKIFLLKREIDNLRSQVVDAGSFRSVDTQNQNLSSSSAAAAAATSNSNSNSSSMSTTTSMMSYRLPLVTIMLAVGVLLLASRFLRRKLSQIRTADSLLRIDDGDTDTDHDTTMIELQSSVSSFSTSVSSSSHHEGGGGGWQRTPSITVTDHHNTTHNNKNNSDTPTSSFTISDDTNNDASSNSHLAPLSESTTTTTTSVAAAVPNIHFV